MSEGKDNNVNMELIDAATKADAKRVEELLTAGADATYIHKPPGVWGSCDDKTALHMALTSREGCNKDIILKLISAGADVNAVHAKYDWRGSGSSCTAFDQLLKSPLCNDPQVLEAFLQAGAKPNQREVKSHHSMRTDATIVNVPLHKAIGKCNTNVVAVLLRHGADPNFCFTERCSNERGYNQNKSLPPLDLAIGMNSLDLVLLLLSEGADPCATSTFTEHVDRPEPVGVVGSEVDDPRDPNYVSPVVCVQVTETMVHRAIRNGNADIVRALMVAGADPSIGRKRGDDLESTEALVARQSNVAKELSDALKASTGWSPENHKYFSEQLREQVRTVLLAAKASNWALPPDVLQEIFVQLAAASTSK